MVHPQTPHVFCKYINIRFWGMSYTFLFWYNISGSSKMQTENHRNSAQLIVEAHNLNVKRKIEKFETLDDTSKNVPSCAIVVTEAEDDKKIDDKDKNANRLSIGSISSAESARSDNVHDDAESDVNIEHGSSVFYVVWD